MLALILQIIGFFGAISILRSIAPFFLSKVLGKAKPIKSGSWAVVTGASDGIGYAYCEALAKSGMNVLLISRTKSKLDECAAKLKEQFPQVEIKMVVADFSNSTQPGFAAPIAAACKDLDIGILVNNVGQSYEMPTDFVHEETTDGFLIHLTNLNAHSAALMSKMVIPDMVAKKKGGYVINISSAAGVMPCGSPMLAGYSATKAHMAALSKSIHYEVSGAGVTCQVHAPYFVVSKMSKIRKPSLMTPTPKQWVASSLSMLGYGGTVLVPYWPHFLQDFVVGLIPEWVSGWYTNRLHKDIRRRALRKKEREAAEAAKSK
jgi:17beta-estradiol 17-dehydrogenase / very-long-chain 3-oxoacyl-CoA reductase